MRKQLVDVTIDRTDWLEPLVSPTGTRPLVSGRGVTLRVLAHASQAVPLSMGIEVYDVAGRLLSTPGSRLSGPTTVPTTAGGLNDAGYRFTLPPDWVRSGLRVVVTADPAQQYEDPTPANARATLQPTVARAQVMRLTAVPVVIAGDTAMLPSDEEIRDALAAVYPLTDVRITRRAPYTSTVITEPITASNESDTGAWGKLLGEINSLRKLEGTTGQHYFGFIPKVDYWGTVGIGYMPGTVAIGRAPRAAGQTGWRGTLQHEKGHNFGRPHSPCGTSGDSSYPYSGGTLGTVWGFDRRDGSFLDPSRTKDLMSYCGPSWVSDWTYDKVQAYLAGNPLDDLAGGTAKASAVAQQPLWLVQGSLHANAVSLQPLVAFRGQPDADAGSHRLRLVFTDGRTQSVRFTPQAMDHQPGDAQFAVAVPAEGSVASIEVYKGSALIHQQAVASSAPRAGTASRLAAAEPTLQADGAGWLLRWDAQRWPRATVTHVGSARTVLALNAGGGQWRIDRASLPEAGGHLEVSLTDGAAFSIQQLTLGEKSGNR